MCLLLKSRSHEIQMRREMCCAFNSGRNLCSETQKRNLSFILFYPPNRISIVRRQSDTTVTPNTMNSWYIIHGSWWEAMMRTHTNTHTITLTRILPASIWFCVVVQKQLRDWIDAAPFVCMTLTFWSKFILVTFWMILYVLFRHFFDNLSLFLQILHNNPRKKKIKRKNIHWMVC